MEEKKVYDKVQWFTGYDDKGDLLWPEKGIFVKESGWFYFGDDPVTDDVGSVGRDRTSATEDLIYDLESDAWVAYGRTQSERAIAAIEESERAMLNAIDARKTEELRRMTGTEKKEINNG